MELILIIYLALVLGYRFVEMWVMARAGTMPRRPARDGTAWLVSVPYWLVIAAPVVEYVYGGRVRPGAGAVALGLVLFGVATAIRVRAHLDQAAQVAIFMETGQREGLVTAGLYAHIRHPLHLANLVLFLACPTFLAARWSWLSVVVGFAGVLTRVEIEESLLRERFDGYAAYARKTWKLVPRVY